MPLNEKELAATIGGVIDKKLGELEKSLEKKQALFGGGPADTESERIDSQLKGYRDLQHLDKQTRKSAVQFGRVVKGFAMANWNGGQMALNSIKNMYPDDKQVHDWLGKALGVTVPSDGGYTVPQALAADMIPYLYSRLAFMKLGARRVPMPNGNLNLPRLDTPSTFYWIGENTTVTKTQPVIGNVKLAAKKGGMIVPESNDLIRMADISSDLWITNDIVIRLQLGLELAAITGIGTAYSPKGLDSLIVSTNLIGSSTTKLTGDTPGLIKGQLLALNVPMVSPGWMFNGYVWSWLYNWKTTTGAYVFRAEMDTGKLLGDPFVVVNQITSPGGTTYGTDLQEYIYYGDFNEFIWGEALAMEITASREASYDSDGSGTMVSAFANDQTVIRAITEVDFALRHSAAFIRSLNELVV